MARARRSCSSLRKEKRKPTTTERMPRLRKTRIASSTSFSSSGVPTRPSGGRMRSVTGMRLRRLTRGRDCHGTSKWSEKLCGRLWRAMCRTSRKLRVVSIPTSAPLCSMVMLVATVVPWTTRSTSSRVTPAISQSSCRPFSTPSDWSFGVLWTLWTNTPRSDSSTRSVFVPPTSTPTRAPIASSRGHPRRGRRRRPLHARSFHCVTSHPAARRGVVARPGPARRPRLPTGRPPLSRARRARPAPRPDARPASPPRTRARSSPRGR